MNFYIDFEATQFSERIISIGCIAENGETFYSLVKPNYKYKITKFITELTGITKEMIEEAPDADVVFSSFFHWLHKNSTEKPKFYCYGDCDKTYIDNTLKDITNYYASLALSLMSANLVDYSPKVAEMFNRTVNLKRVYNVLKEEKEQQTHDALEDAVMLKYVVDNIKNISKELAVSRLKDTPKPVKPKKEGAPAAFLEWDNKNLWEADTHADETEYQYKCTCATGTHTKYFKDLETMALWAIKYLTRNLSPKKSNHIEQVQNSIKKAIRTGKGLYGLQWEFNINN